MLQCCHIVLCSEILDQNRLVCWSIVVIKEPTLRSPLFWTFLSDHIPKATEDDSAHLFIHNFTFRNGLKMENALAGQNSCKFYQRNPWTFWRDYVQSPPEIPVSFDLYSVVELQHKWRETYHVNPLNPELNPICYLLALLGAHHFFHISRIRVKSLTFRRLTSYIYIYGAPILDVSRSHTTTQHSR